MKITFESSHFIEHFRHQNREFHSYVSLQFIAGTTVSVELWHFKEFLFVVNVYIN